MLTEKHPDPRLVESMTSRCWRCWRRAVHGLPPVAFNPKGPAVSCFETMPELPHSSETRQSDQR